MNGIDDLIEKIKNTRMSRRRLIDKPMQELMNEGLDCLSCSGCCCTFVKNSMMITPVESVDICLDLYSRDLVNDSLLHKLQETIDHFRLDQPVAGDGRRSFSRRRYTCPFFNEQRPSCGVSRSYKPYGCLAFNPQKAGVSDGESCQSYQDLLKNQEKQSKEEHAVNDQLVSFWGLDWQKKPLPVAVLDVLKHLSFLVPK